ncbi:phage tail tube protein [uncultured Methylophaga sp.]|uniref:phage tail tube protein n=1 Tax=uncultured Methylophaga sp. TaxID=285271 RepID=UPI0026129C7D|nr:phage tail tube protein [uncultured Methylophaga sp.]
MSQITGRAFISINGSRLKSRPGATLNIGGFNRETQTGDDGVHGYKEAVMQPSVSCTISHDKDVSLKELADATDVSITFETDTGRTYIMSPSWLTAPPELNSQEGTIPLTYEGMNAEEV